MQRTNHGDENDHEHHDDVNAQAPKQQPRGHGKIALAETRASFCGDHLIRFEQGQHDARILEIGTLRASRRRLGFRGWSAVTGIS